MPGVPAHCYKLDMRIATVLLLLLAAGSLRSAELDPEARLLRWMDRIAQSQLDRRALEVESVSTVDAAERRKQQVREKIFDLIGGLPDYSGPLNAKVTGQIEKPDYIIENVVFESLPRLWITANLYRPRAPGRYPGILISVGHWDQGKLAEQANAANFAKKGFVALVYDPIGQGERIVAYDARLKESLGAWSTEQHIQLGAQSLLVGQSLARYMIWDAMRAVDYLVSRPEVEASRIGSTGCSGGGTLTTYIAALDPRIKAAAPACWMNSYRALFTGPVGDDEQSPPGFIASGLDQADYVELFAPKPWLIVSTIDDFFPLEGARRTYEEARHWYRLYGAQDHIDWAVGPGTHGTPLPVRERIYEWMIRWLKDGKGDAREAPVQMAANRELLVTPGQVTTDLEGRELHTIIRERIEKRDAPQPDRSGVVEAILPLMKPEAEGPVTARVVSETRDADVASQRILLETEPGLELEGTLLLPRKDGRKSALVVVETEGGPSPAATVAARRGVVVLSLNPRGLPRRDDHRPMGVEWQMNTRALLIGRNLPGLRAYDIRRAVDLLAARTDVDPASIRGAARGEAGVWLLLAAAADSRIHRIWLDKTPYSLRASLDTPLNRNLHAAVIRGFCLKWDLDSLVSAMGDRTVVWSDPADWLGSVTTTKGNYLYRTFGEGDTRFLDELLR